MASAQFFSFSKDYELRREDSCATITNPFPARQEKVEMTTCHGQGRDQEWAHTKVGHQVRSGHISHLSLSQAGKIIHKPTKLCLDAGGGQSMELLNVAPCKNVPSQIWFFDHYTK